MSISGILTHVLRSEYGTFSLASGHKSRGIYLNLKTNFEHFGKEFGHFISILGLFGTFSIFLNRMDRKKHIYIQLFWFYTLFFAWRSNLDPDNDLYYGVLQRFYLQNSIILILFACQAMKAITDGIQSYFQWSALPDGPNSSFVILVIGLSYALRRLPQNDYSSNTQGEKLSIYHYN